MSTVLTWIIFLLQVKDQEFPYRKNLAWVLVEVEDLNDHVPIFTSALYEGSVYESAAVGSAVVQVTALDKDKGQNAELTYSIEGGKQKHLRKMYALPIVLFLVANWF